MSLVKPDCGDAPAAAGASAVPIREDLVRRIRARVAQGTYLTRGALEGAIERVHEELSRRRGSGPITSRIRAWKTTRLRAG